MRKDLRVGLGIGLVLLAVLVVAMVVKSRTHRDANNPKYATSTTQAPADGGDGTPPADPGTSATADAQNNPTPPASTPGATEPSAPGRRDVFEQDPPPAKTGDKTNDNWDRMLLKGVDSTENRVITSPPLRGGERSASSDHGMTPGSLPGGGTSLDPTNPPATPGRTSTTAHVGSGAFPRSHKVTSGETLSTIAKAAYGNKKYYLDIEKANPGVDPSHLRINQEIKLPEISDAERAVDRPGRPDRHTARGGSREGSRDGDAIPASAVDARSQYVVKSGDSLYRICSKLWGNANELDALYDLNKSVIGPDREKLKLGMTLKLPKAPSTSAALH